METLKHNSENMKTIVETFLIEETIDLIYDNEKLDKWNNLVNELGLKGQTQITKPEKSPIPFMHMKQSFVNVFQTLCPRRVPVTEFNVTPIPIEILDLVALSQREQYFGSIEVWYDEKTPDPAVVGVLEHWVLHEKGTCNTVKNTPSFTCKKDAEHYRTANNLDATTYKYTFGDYEKYYLIGKWADVRRSIDELKQMAIKRFTEDRINTLTQEIKERQRQIEDIEHDAYAKFN